MRAFTDDEAIELWIAKWLGMKKHDIAAKYKQNMFRIYEVWREEENIGTRLKASILFKKRYPKLAPDVDFSPHTQKFRIDRKLMADKNQLDFFNN